MREFIRLLYLVVVILPLSVLLVGPLLTLAALRGRQRLGQIVFDPGRRGAIGRVGALLLGLLVWLAVWGSLGLILIWFGLPALGNVSSLMPRATIAPTAPLAAPLVTPTPSPAATIYTPAPPTLTQPPTEVIPASSPSPSPSPLPPTLTPLSPTATSTPVPATPTPTPVPATPKPLPTASVTALPTLSTEQGAKIAAVEAANDLLRSAVVEPSIGNLAALETLWQGRALVKVQAFAQDLYQGFRRPLDVTFVYLAPPLVLEGVTSDTTLVTSTEVWTYTGSSVTHSETFKFTYTLGWQDEGWVIIDYAYGYAPGFPPPSKEGTPTPSFTLTATPSGAQ